MGAISISWVLHFLWSLIMSSKLYIERIAPFGRQSTVIQWALATELRAMGSVTFKLELSGNPDGPWEIVAENLVDTLVYEDTNYKTYSNLKDKYYRVSLQDGTFVSEPRPVLGSIPKKQWLVSRKIFNDEMTMLKKANGIKISVIKRKHWGDQCECVDPATKLSLDPNCKLCNGTKIVNGYYTPITTWGNIQPSAIGTDKGAQSSIPEIETTQAMLLSFPLVYKDDILVEIDTNRRWLVVSSKSTELLRNDVHQDIIISRLPESDKVYELDVPSCYHQNIL